MPGLQFKEITATSLSKKEMLYALCSFTSETDNLFLPLALLAANTLLPLAVAIRSRKPCLFLLFL